MSIKPRDFWNAKPPKKGFAKPGEIKGLVVHWSAYPKANSIEEEKKQLLQIQDLHQNTRKWNDIAYSFAVGDSGNLYECRGFENRSASQGGKDRQDTNYNNKHYLSVVWLGGSNADDYPSEAAINAVKWLWREVGGELRPHNSFKKTTCPGKAWDKLIEARLVSIREDKVKNINQDIYNWNIGDKGSAVKRIQTLLNSSMKSHLVTDGIYGKNTQKAVIAFQKKHLKDIVTINGQVNPITYAKLLEIEYIKLTKGNYEKE